MATEAPLSTKSAQLTNTLLMISPDQFSFNEQTAATNAFQNTLAGTSATDIRAKAIAEFNGTVEILRSNGVEIVVCPSRKDVVTPDAVFPNNWVSFHQEIPSIDAILYPMLAPNRRAERQFDTVKGLLSDLDPRRVLDLTGYENAGYFLEGTGSLIFDRRGKVVFAHESPRTSGLVLDKFCQETGYRPVKFHSFDTKHKPIYHTNVVMSIGDGFAVVALASIREREERLKVEEVLRDLELEVIDITLPQVSSFCGNVLEVESVAGKPKILMSNTAHDAFTKTQLKTLRNYGEPIPVSIPIIETIGGGSARCMVAEVFPKKVSY